MALFGLALAATAAPAVSGADRGGQSLRGSNFYSNCPFSHDSTDDPIVYPGQPGASHAHTFFGNRSTNAFSTRESLLLATTTCKPRADKAAYWVPTLFKNGREVRPSKAQLYYVVRGHARMRAFPPGLRIVAGDAHATHVQSRNVTYWTCGGRAAHMRAMSRIPAHCGVIVGHGLGGAPGGKVREVRWRTKTYLELHVIFPDCWDGRHLDSGDHHSHMAYSRSYRCPTSHPVRVPRIRMMVRYPIDRGAGVELASGGQITGHADFYNAWNQRFLERLVASCFAERGCKPY